MPYEDMSDLHTVYFVVRALWAYWPTSFHTFSGECILLFVTDSLFGKFPFLLPPLINSIILAIGTVMTISMVPETLKK